MEAHQGLRGEIGLEKGVGKAIRASEFHHKAQPQFFINSALAENKSFLFF
jgi:hypothetical protein